MLLDLQGVVQEAQEPLRTWEGLILAALALSLAELRRYLNARRRRGSNR